MSQACFGRGGPRLAPSALAGCWRAQSVSCAQVRNGHGGHAESRGGHPRSSAVAPVGARRPQRRRWPSNPARPAACRPSSGVGASRISVSHCVHALGGGSRAARNHSVQGRRNSSPSIGEASSRDAHAARQVLAHAVQVDWSMRPPGPRRSPGFRMARRRIRSRRCDLRPDRVDVSQGDVHPGPHDAHYVFVPQGGGADGGGAEDGLIPPDEIRPLAPE